LRTHQEEQELHDDIKGQHVDNDFYSQCFFGVVPAMAVQNALSNGEVAEQSDAEITGAEMPQRQIFIRPFKWRRH
jgi:hypothetical protein